MNPQNSSKQPGHDAPHGGLSRRRLMQWAALSPMVSAAAQAGAASVTRLVLPLSPGGAMDVLGRGLALQLGKRLDSTVVVENRAGAGGNIASELVAAEKPDGRTLLLTGNSLVVNVTLYGDRLRYDPQRSFAPISIVATTATVLVVRAASPAHDMAGLLRQARSGGVTVGTPGHGNTNHLALVKLQGAVDGELRHIPYKGAGPALAALLGGETDAAIVALPAASAQLAAGSLRAIVVLDARRSSIAPQVPTLAEAGIQVVPDAGWFGLLAPAGTPPAIVAQLQRAVAQSLADPVYRATLRQQGFEPVGSTPQAFAAQIQADAERFPPLLQRIGARVD